MRAWPSRNQHKVGRANDSADRLGNSRRRVDNCYAVTGAREKLQLFRQFDNRHGGEFWRLGLAHVPPGGQGALRIGVDEDDGTVTGGLGNDGEMRSERSLPGPALLAC